MDCRSLIALLASTVLILFASAGGTAVAASGQISGTVTYADASPGVGVEVDIELPAGPDGSIDVHTAVSDQSGHWEYGPLPTGSYDVYFVVVAEDGANWTEGHAAIVVTGDAQAPLTTVLSNGPQGPGVGTLTGTTSLDSGPLRPQTFLTIERSDGAVDTAAELDSQGRFSMILRPGSYTVAPENIDGLDAAIASVTATVTPGEVTDVSLALTALPVAPGATAANSARDVGFLNAERARWGLPSGVVENPVWSQACGSHDAYLNANHLFQHYEYPGPGFAPGGDWAGTHAVLSEGTPWTADANPFEDAPIHLDQLMTPDLAMSGISELDGFVCATTWPGLLGLRAPAGSVFTYPGDGTVGLPPAEDAEESPLVPGQSVGIPQGTIAGRELLVYEEDDPIAPFASIASASLVDSAGRSVPIRWVNTDDPNVGAFLSGAIIIPVAPLAPNTTYTATVDLNAHGELPATTHRWSFTTGAANPGGHWPRSFLASAPSRATMPRTPRLILSHVRMTHRCFRVAPRHRVVTTAAPYGTAFEFQLTLEATIAIDLSRVMTGLRHGRACVPVTPRHAARVGARRCTRSVAVGRLVRARQRRGVRRIAFSGRIGARALAPGSYRAVLRAANATGHSAAATAFTVLAPRPHR